MLPPLSLKYYASTHKWLLICDFFFSFQPVNHSLHLCLKKNTKHLTLFYYVYAITVLKSSIILFATKCILCIHKKLLYLLCMNEKETKN